MSDNFIISREEAERLTALYTDDFLAQSKETIYLLIDTGDKLRKKMGKDTEHDIISTKTPVDITVRFIKRAMQNVRDAMEKQTDQSELSVLDNLNLVGTADPAKIIAHFISLNEQNPNYTAARKNELNMVYEKLAELLKVRHALPHALQELENQTKANENHRT